MTAAPVYQSEIATTDIRGRLVAFNQLGFVAGMAAGYAAGYTLSLWRTTWGLYLGWRIAVMAQYLPAFVFGVSLPFISESPRWLVAKNDLDGARDTLTWLHHETHTAEQIEEELEDIKQSTTEYRRSLMSLAMSPELRPRLWRAAFLQVLSQVCGAAAIKHYLPPLVSALGIDMELSLTSHAVEEMFRFGLTVVGMLIIDRYGRRVCLAAGSVIMAFSALVTASPLPIQAVGICVSMSRTRGGVLLDILWITFILAYAVGYCIGIGPVSWIYTVEIFPNATRARGVNLAAAAGALGSLLISKMWTPGVPQSGGTKYFIFAAVNAVAVPIIWRYFPETKGRALEDMDTVFGSSVEGFQHIENSDDLGDFDIDLGDDSSSEFGSVRDSIELQDYHNGRKKAMV
ncbi:Arabinose-proton symporter [Ceratocystis lukuohia]|uniref:Arabinose-proton symporter n=1 Tax=Ceratocystis lukuohia TaxID=2019550 RepID=A0ABR4MNJ9_9PEZI